MLRKDWQFSYEVTKLAAGAKAKVEFHQQRLKFWSDAKSDVMRKIKESGLEISESAAGSNYGKSGFGPQVQVDSTMERQLTECHSKAKEHSEKINEFEGWVQVFESNAGGKLNLNADDYLYFFGK